MQEKHGKEHESDGIDVLDIKLNNTTNSISPSSFHVNKDENVPTGVTEKAPAQCSQPLFPDKSNDLIYGVERRGSSQYLLKHDVIIYDGSTNYTSVDSYAYVVLFSTVGYIPNNVEYSWPDDIIVIASTCLGIAKSGSEDWQFFINGIQKTTWKTNKYKLYCFKNLPLKQKGLQHKFQNHVHEWNRSNIVVFESSLQTQPIIREHQHSQDKAALKERAMLHK